MNAKLHRNEQGVTALETAIILIAFVVVAAVFAFTILSTGTFLTERSKEAAYAGLQEVRGSMQIKGSMVITGTAVNTNTDTVIFNLATVSGGESVDLSKVKVTYRDANINQDLTYNGAATFPAAASTWVAVDALNPTTTLKILPTGGLAKFIIKVPAALTANQTFALEIKPLTGGTLLLQRTTPAQLDTVTDLH